MAENVITRAMNLAEPVESDPKKVKTLIRSITKKITEVKEVKSSLLGIEKDAKPLLEAKLTALENEKKILNVSIKKDAKTGKPYKKLSFEPLKWRNKGTGWPTIGIFSISNRACSFDLRDAYYGEGSFTKSPSLPAPLAELYNDVRTKLKARCNRNGLSHCSITAHYHGILPAEIRERIKTEQKNFQEIYILAEVREWKVDEVVQPRPVDPLVVGWDGANLWLLDNFDLTPAEKYIEDEFTV